MTRRLRIDDINTRYQGGQHHSEYNQPVQAVPNLNDQPHYINRQLHSVISYPDRSNIPADDFPDTHNHDHETHQNSNRRAIAPIARSRSKKYEILEPIAEQQFQSDRGWSNDKPHKKGQRPLSVSREKQNPYTAPLPPSLGMRNKSHTPSGSIGNCQNCFSQRCIVLTCLGLCFFVIIPLVVVLIYHTKSNVVVAQENYLDGIVQNPRINDQLLSKVDREYANQISAIISREVQLSRQGQIANPGLVTSINPNRVLTPPIIPPLNTIIGPNSRCRRGFIFVAGKCLSCPDDAFWDGNNCVKYVVVNKTSQVFKNNYHTSAHQLTTNGHQLLNDPNNPSHQTFF